MGNVLCASGPELKGLSVAQGLVDELELERLNCQKHRDSECNVKHVLCHVFRRTGQGKTHRRDKDDNYN